MVEGDELATGLDDAPGRPVLDELTGADDVIGWVDEPGVAPGDVPGLVPTEAPAQPAAMTMTARIDCQASELVTRMEYPLTGGRALGTDQPRP
jgi:hypothetical protein